jgi:hypothetical protein
MTFSEADRLTPTTTLPISNARPSLKSLGIRRKTGKGIYKSNPRPNQSKAIKRCWADPAYRAKRAEGQRQHFIDRARDPDRYSRVGIPNGMRRAEAMAMWERASTLADEAMRQLQERGILPATASLDLEMATDEDLANLAIREALKMTLGPSTLRDKLDAARLVLTYTKAKPPTVADTRALLDKHGHDDQTGLLLALIGASSYADEHPRPRNRYRPWEARQEQSLVATGRGQL